jgi:hypothetical protein
MTHASLSPRDRVTLEKAARDTGFDRIAPSGKCAWVEASNSHVPLHVWLLRDGAGFAVGLSMRNVLDEIERDADRHAHAARSVEDASAWPRGAVGWLCFDAIDAVDACLARAWRRSNALPDELVIRFTRAVAEAMAAAPEAPSTTEREAVVRQRVGQQLFRDGLMALWNGCCAISGLAVPELLRASHAKPWADATDAERLDVYNGLLLAAHLDAAFDAGLIAVEVDGRVRVGPSLDAAAQAVLGLTSQSRVVLSPRHRPFMAWHRKRVFGLGE